MKTIKLFSIDEQEPTTLEAIIAENNLPDEIISDLKKLKVGHGMFVGLTDIKRVE